MAQICMATDSGGGGCSGGGAAPRRTYRRRRYTRRYKRAYRRSGKTLYKRQKRVVKKKMSRFLLAQINPFHPLAEGCKVPDSNTFPSTPVRADDTFSISLGTLGNVNCFAFRPTVTRTIVSGVEAAGSWTWAAGYTGAIDSGRRTAIQSNYSLIRSVAHGIRIYSPVAPTSATGFIHIAIVANSMYNTSTWSFPTTLAQMSNCMYYNRFPLSLLTQKAVTVTNKFLDCTSTRYYSPASDLASDTSTNDMMLQTDAWGTILVAIDGVPKDQVLQIEQIVHLEALPSPSGVNTSTPAAAYSPQEIQTASVIVSHQEAATVEGETPIGPSGLLYNAIISGAQTAYAEVGAPALSYAGQAAGYAATTAAAGGLIGITNRLMPTAFRRSNGMLT